MTQILVQAAAMRAISLQQIRSQWISNREAVSYGLSSLRLPFGVLTRKFDKTGLLAGTSG